MLIRALIGTMAGVAAGALLGYATFDPAHNMGGMDVMGTMIATSTLTGMIGAVVGTVVGFCHHVFHDS